MIIIRIVTLIFIAFEEKEKEIRRGKKMLIYFRRIFLNAYIIHSILLF